MRCCLLSTALRRCDDDVGRYNAVSPAMPHQQREKLRLRADLVRDRALLSSKKQQVSVATRSWLVPLMRRRVAMTTVQRRLACHATCQQYPARLFPVHTTKAERKTETESWLSKLTRPRKTITSGKLYTELSGGLPIVVVSVPMKKSGKFKFSSGNPVFDRKRWIMFVNILKSLVALMLTFLLWNGRHEDVTSSLYDSPSPPLPIILFNNCKKHCENI